MASEPSIELRDYIERILEEREKSLEMTAKVLDHRLESLNELRGQVLSDRDQFMRREVYDQAHSALDQRVKKLEDFSSRILGAIVVIVAITGLVGVIVQYVTRVK